MAPAGAASTPERHVWPRLRSLRPLTTSDLSEAEQGGRPDAMILDMAELRGRATTAVVSSLALARRRARRWVVVRLAPLMADRIDADLDALGPAWPDAVLLTGCTGASEIQRCGVKLAVREATLGFVSGHTAILAAPGPAGLLALAGFAASSPRLAALVWDAAGLATALRVPVSVGGTDVAEPFLPLKLQLLLGARAAGVAAYDGAVPGRSIDPRHARRLGFDGMVAGAPEDIAAIDSAFADVSLNADD